jgi:hypothetical protein
LYNSCWFSWNVRWDTHWAAFTFLSLEFVTSLIARYLGAGRSALDFIVETLASGTFLCPPGEWSANNLSLLIEALAHVDWYA